jgi:hypothetical protein
VFERAIQLETNVEFPKEFHIGFRMLYRHSRDDPTLSVPLRIQLTLQGRQCPFKRFA